MPPPPTRTRRRGAALEAALLAAAWEELEEHGYAGLTFGGVARRADTSRAVLYRRWASKTDLVRAAIGHYADNTRGSAPDTGSLRGDAIALMSDFSQRRAGAVALFAVGLGTYYEETGTSMVDLRNELIAGARDLVGEIVQRAIARGEVDADRATARIVRLPYDLLRNELLLTMAPVPTEVIEEIVDTIFLPLIAPQQTGPLAVDG